MSVPIQILLAVLAVALVVWIARRISEARAYARRETMGFPALVNENLWHQAIRLIQIANDEDAADGDGDPIEVNETREHAPVEDISRPVAEEPETESDPQSSEAPDGEKFPADVQDSVDFLRHNLG